MGMARFIGKIVVEQDGAWWVLKEPLTYEDGALTVVVPAGFVTDFASVPKLFWNLAAPTEPDYSEASVVHDRLYETHEVSKVVADIIFARAMSIGGTPLWKRRIMWLAVHYFGGVAYATGPQRQAERLRIYRQHEQWAQRTAS